VSLGQQASPSGVWLFPGFDKPWFLTEGKLAAILIKPSSWGSQLDGDLHYHTPPQQGSIRLSDLTKSDPSAGKTVTMAMSDSSVGSSSEVNLQVSFTMIEKEDAIEELDEIMKNLDLAEAMDHSDSSYNFSRNIAVDCTTRNGGVSNNVHQVSVIIIEASAHNDV
jgi:hypothetical protein